MSEHGGMVLVWTCETCGWHTTVAMPGFGGDGFNHYIGGSAPCGPLTARRATRKEIGMNPEIEAAIVRAEEAHAFTGKMVDLLRSGVGAAEDADRVRGAADGAQEAAKAVSDAMIGLVVRTNAA